MNLARLLTVIALLLFNVEGLAQSQKTRDTRVIADTIERSLRASERELVEAADAMPEDKYSFTPTDGDFKGVRTFGEQVKHVASVNFHVWADIKQEKPSVEPGGADGPASLKSKAEIVQFLKASFIYAHKAVAAENDGYLVEPINNPFGGGTTTRLSMAIGALVHAQDHYGQMVEYLRMNRIIPPESR